MSRLAKKPIPLPSGVKVESATGVVRVSGPKGKLEQKVPAGVRVSLAGDGKALQVTREGDGKRERALHGTIWSLLTNMVLGVVTPYQKLMLIEGVGYRAAVQGRKLSIQVGFTHPVALAIPSGLEVECPVQTQILVRGADRQVVGEFAALIRRVKPPEPSKGKGIRYSDEVVKKKAGKSFGATATGGGA